MKTALVCGAGGFIGSQHGEAPQKRGLLGERCRLEVSGIRETEADDFMIGDLRDIDVCYRAVDRKFDEIYQFAADMGGAGFVLPVRTMPILCITL